MVLASMPLDGTGTATFQLTEPVGKYSITAVYLGNSSFAAVHTSPPENYVVNAPTADATTVGYFNGPEQAIAHQPFVFVVGIQDLTDGSTIPTGEVDILANGNKIGSGDLDPTTGLVGITVPSPSLPAGMYSITAIYLGNSSFQPTNSSVNFTVFDTATVSFTVDSPPIANQPIIVTATVGDTIDSAAIPTGQVQIIENDTTPIGLGIVGSNGQVTIAALGQPAGSYTLSADFFGTGNYESSASQDIPIAVTAAQTPTSTSPTSTSPTSKSPTSTSPTSTSPTSTSPTSTTPTSTPSPTPPKLSGAPTIGQSKKGTAFTFTFTAPLNQTSANNAALYKVLQGVTKVVKKHKQTLFTKALKIKSVVYSPSLQSVTITLAKSYKGPAQVTIEAGLETADGTTTTTSIAFPA